MDFAILDRNIPSSILPAISIQNQIRIIENWLNSLMKDMDLVRKREFVNIVKSIKNRDYNYLFKDKQPEKDYSYWEGKNIVIINKKEINASDLFNKNLKLLQIIRKQLKKGFWVLITTSDKMVIFSLSCNHFLAWSIILPSLEDVFLAFIILEGKLQNIATEDLEWYFFETRKKELINLFNELYSKNTLNGFKINDFESFYLSFYKSMIKINQKFIETTENKSIITNFNDINDFEKLKTELSLIHTYKLIRRHLKNLSLSNSSNQITRQLSEILLSKLTQIEFSWIYDINPLLFLEIFSTIVQKEYSIKDSGVYYTPAHLAELLTHNLMESYFSFKKKTNTLEIRIYDPAMGTGIFIIFALEWLVNYSLENISIKDSYVNLRKRFLLKNLFGSEIDKISLATGRYIISTFCNLSPNIVKDSTNYSVSDFIQKSIEYIQDKREIQKFDIIITNPPYLAFHSRFTKKIISNEVMTSLQRILPNFCGKRNNSYLIFMGFCLKYYLKSPEGVIGLVIDHSFLDLPTYSHIRQHILHTYFIKYILKDYSYSQAAVDLSLLIISMEQNSVKKTLWQQDLLNDPLSITSSYFYSNPNISFNYRPIPHFITRILTKCINLGDIATLSCGLEYGALLKTDFLSSTKKNRTWFRVIDGSNGIPDQYILFWVDGFSNSYVRFDKNYEEHLIETKQNISKTGKKVLLIPGELERFLKPKIILRQTADRFIATVDDQKFLSLRNTHLIYSVKKPYSVYSVSGILNSSFGNWIGEYMNIIRKGGKNRYPQIRLNSLKKFPLVKINTKNESQIITKIENLAIQCTQVGREIEKNLKRLWEIIQTSKPKKYKIQRQFLKQYYHKDSLLPLLSHKDYKDEKTDLISLKNNFNELQQLKKDIDVLIFKLYGISDRKQKEIVT